MLIIVICAAISFDCYFQRIIFLEIFDLVKYQNIILAVYNKTVITPQNIKDKDKRDHSINGTVQDKGTGQYELSFTPRSPGTYEVHVTIDDEHIEYSPFTFYAEVW